MLKSVHLATVALKDELIAALRSELSTARTDRLRADSDRNAAVSKAFELLTPKPAEVAKPGVIVRRPVPEPETLDLSKVDPTDNHALAAIAVSEMGGGRLNASALQSKIESLRGQVLLAQAAKRARAQEVGTVTDTPQMDIPPDIAAMIDAAEAKGKEQARAN